MNCQFIWQINYSYSKGINKFINTIKIIAICICNANIIIIIKIDLDPCQSAEENKSLINRKIERIFNSNLLIWANLVFENLLNY